MAGLADISGGRADYGYSSPSRSLFDDLAAKAMQTQEVPVAPNMGYAMPSAPIIQDSPFAQYAWRTVPNLFGGLGVQPLMGFPSAYPHVLNGTPDSFLRWIPMLQSMMPPMQPLQWPQQKQGKTVQPMSPVSAAAQASTTTRPAGNVNTTPSVTPTTPPTQQTPQRVPIKLSEVQQVEPSHPIYEGDYSGVLNLVPNILSVWDYLATKNPDLVTVE